MDGRKSASRAAVITLIVCLVIASVPAYILSAGPFIWLVGHGYADPLMYQRVYWPLIQACGLSQGLNDWVNWYLSWWGPPIGGVRWE
jgi:hypothetical protein